MGFTSDDDLLNQATVNGKILERDCTKITGAVHTAGGWHCLAGAAGHPNGGTFPGTDLLWSNCSEQDGDGTTIIGSQMGGNVATATKHLAKIGAQLVAAAGAPWVLHLIDLLGFYRLSTTNVTGTGSRALINSNTFTASSSSGLLLTYANDFKNYTKVRFTTTTTLPTGLSLNTDYWLVRQSATTAKVATSFSNAVAGTFIAFTDAGTGTHTLTTRVARYNGAGVEAFFVAQTAPTAGGPNLSASSYTNQAGTAARAFQGSPSMGAAADAYATRILHSGNAAGRYGAYLPKQGADTGILSVESFTWSGGTAYTGSGVVALCLAKILARIQIPASGAYMERDLRHQLLALPKIEDGACIVPVLFSAGATTANSPLIYDKTAVWGG
jgi:hypothetical protein